MANRIRPRRSVLYVPGTNERALEKAKSLETDALIFDLEDSVAPEQKTLAREQVVKHLKNGDFGYRELIIRINGFNTPWGSDDLKAGLESNPDAILIPKISTSEELDQIEKQNAESLGKSESKIWVMMETPLAILNANAIASVAEKPESKLDAFVMGTNDLAKDTGAKLTNDRIAMVPWLMTCLAAARSYGLSIIDGVFNDFSDSDGFTAECQQGSEFGMDGKTLIHPNQIAPCNDIFSPSDESVSWSQKIIREFDRPENSEKGVIRVEGQMVERLHLQIAKNTVEIAESIKQRS